MQYNLQASLFFPLSFYPFCFPFLQSSFQSSPITRSKWISSRCQQWIKIFTLLASFSASFISTLLDALSTISSMKSYTKTYVSISSSTYIHSCLLTIDAYFGLSSSDFPFSRRFCLDCFLVTEAFFDLGPFVLLAGFDWSKRYTL